MYYILCTTAKYDFSYNYFSFRFAIWTLWSFIMQRYAFEQRVEWFYFKNQRSLFWNEKAEGNLISLKYVSYRSLLSKCIVKLHSFRAVGGFPIFKMSAVCFCISVIEHWFWKLFFKTMHLCKTKLQSNQILN